MVLMGQRSPRDSPVPAGLRIRMGHRDCMMEQGNPRESPVPTGLWVVQCCHHHSEVCLKIPKRYCAHECPYTFTVCIVPTEWSPKDMTVEYKYTLVVRVYIIIPQYI